TSPSNGIARAAGAGLNEAWRGGVEWGAAHAASAMAAAGQDNRVTFTAPPIATNGVASGRVRGKGSRSRVSRSLRLGGSRGRLRSPPMRRCILRAPPVGVLRALSAMLGLSAQACFERNLGLQQLRDGTAGLGVLGNPPKRRLVDVRDLCIERERDGGDREAFAVFLERDGRLGAHP